MFTRDSKKLRVVVMTILVIGSIFSVVNYTMTKLAWWAERSAGTYPYRSEDWLRYFLASVHRRDEVTLLLAGESAVRENLIFERFQEHFPNMITVQGGLSLGTLDDVLVALEYLKRAFNKSALPRILVLGISPRFVANIPEGKSPLVEAVNQYSAFRVIKSPNGPRLKRKKWFERSISALRYQTKQQARYRAALVTVLHKLIPSDVSYHQLGGEFGKMRAVLDQLKVATSRSPEATRALEQIGVRAILGRWFRVYVSPYKYHYLKPISQKALQEWISDPKSFWDDVYLWNPRSDIARVKNRFERLLEFARRNRISLYVVNLPENPISRKRYDPDNYHQYLDLVHEALGDTPFLDLRELLAISEFYDIVHAQLPGALKVTERVVEFVKRDVEMCCENDQSRP